MFHNTHTSQRNRGQTVEPPFNSVERMFIAMNLGYPKKPTEVRPKLWECIFEVEKVKQKLSIGGAHKTGKSTVFPKKPSLSEQL